MTMQFDSLQARRAYEMQEHGRRIAGERRKQFWSDKAAQEIEDRRRGLRREEDRRKADNAAIADWLARYEIAKAQPAG